MRNGQRTIYTNVARKDMPDKGIKVGDTYYSWQMKANGRVFVQRSKTYPRKSDMTSSDILREAFLCEEGLYDIKSFQALSKMSAEERKEYVVSTVTGLTRRAWALIERIGEMDKAKSFSHLAQISTLLLVWISTVETTMLAADYDDPVNLEDTLLKLSEIELGVD